MTWKEISYHNIRYSPDICVERLRKTKETRSQDNRYSTKVRARNHLKRYSLHQLAWVRSSKRNVCLCVPHMNFEGFTVVIAQTSDFWVVIPCNLVAGCWHFGGTYCLYLQC
jgi:hypothetical protein